MGAVGFSNVFCWVLVCKRVVKKKGHRCLENTVSLRAFPHPNQGVPCTPAYKGPDKSCAQQACLPWFSPCCPR